MAARVGARLCNRLLALHFFGFGRSRPDDRPALRPARGHRRHANPRFVLRQRGAPGAAGRGAGEAGGGGRGLAHRPSPSSRAGARPFAPAALSLRAPRRPSRAAGARRLADLLCRFAPLSPVRSRLNPRSLRRRRSRYRRLRAGRPTFDRLLARALDRPRQHPGRALSPSFSVEPAVLDLDRALGTDRRRLGRLGVLRPLLHGRRASTHRRPCHRPSVCERSIPIRSRPCSGARSARCRDLGARATWVRVSPRGRVSW